MPRTIRYLTRAWMTSQAVWSPDGARRGPSNVSGNIRRPRTLSINTRRQLGSCPLRLSPQAEDVRLGNTPATVIVKLNQMPCLDRCADRLMDSRRAIVHVTLNTTERSKAPGFHVYALGFFVRRATAPAFFLIAAASRSRMPNATPHVVHTNSWNCCEVSINLEGRSATVGCRHTFA
jgi:hypothetical protein